MMIPEIIRFVIRVKILIFPELKKLNGYQKNRAIPEKMISEKTLSKMPVLSKSPYAK
jgi:hypothetical protein